jgi:recombination protein RecA
LLDAVAAIQKRWGPNALRRLGQDATATPVPHIPTGFPALDRALGIGGLPRGKVSELLGLATSGKTTLALKFLAQAQAGGGQVGYLDQARTFDPDYAHRCGLDLSRLLVGTPDDLQEALAMAEALVRDAGLAALVFDTLDDFWIDPDAGRRLTALLDRLAAPLARSGTALLFLRAVSPAERRFAPSRPSPALSALAHSAAVRLQLTRERWLRRHGDIRGYQARVEVLKNRLGPAGQAVSVKIEFNGAVRGNGL